jgi:hypothetical protein
MHLKLRLFTSTLLAISAAAMIGGLVLSRSRPLSAAPAFPTYVAGNFNFAAPQELVRPLNQVEGELDQSVEPEVKVDLFGNIYITGIHGVPGGLDFWKSTNKGASFVYMGQPDGAQDKCGVNGPVVCQNGLGGGDDSIDVSTDGYLYVSSLWAGSVTMSTSYDGGTGGVFPGQAWQVNPVASNLPSDDRQWVAAYGPQTLYMTYNATALTDPPGGLGLFVVKSTDGGKTFGPAVPVTVAGQTNTVNVEGNLVVDQYNGNLFTAYIPTGSDNVINIARSLDGGATWSVITAYTGPAGTTNRGVFPILTVDRGGNLHLAFTNSNAAGHTNAHVFLTSTANPGAPSPTWTTPVRVDNGAANVSACLPWIVGGSSGIVDVTWYGSTATSPDDANALWHVFFAQVTNAVTGSPTIAQNQVETPTVHNHSICFNGFACAGNSVPKNGPENRDLAEYYTMAIDPDGNANIVYEDSVNGSCGTEMDPLGLILVCTSKPWFSKQTAGPSAYAPPAAPAPATFAANLVMPNSSTDAEPNMRADSHNCLYSGAPGNPDAWKSTDAGASFFKLPNPVVSAGAVAGGGDSEIVTFPQPTGVRPDQVYYADLAVASVNISKSIDGGATWFSPGTGGIAGEVSVSTDRQWMSADRNGANQTIYLWEHEFVSQILRMNALTNDSGSPGPPDTRSGGPWSPFQNGMTDPELVALASTVGNTVPGPTFVDPATHQVYGFLSASTPTTNAIGAPTGKLPNVWEADAPGTFTPGVPPGQFTNHPVFKGVIDSPANPAPPAGSATIGSNTANLFNGAAIDAAGNIYATWATPNGRTGLYDVWFASSHDHGKTFYGPFKINPNGIQGNMPWIAAGDNGRIDIVYYGTPDTQDPTTSTSDKWYVFFAQSLNAADREPVFSVAQASDHITHQGPICNVGILCGTGTRQLLDFFQVAIGPDGMANIAYADTGASNGTPHISYARQIGGPSGVANPTFPTCLGTIPLTSVVSRKTHGGAGSFDVNLPLAGTRGVECRGSGIVSDYTLVFKFPNLLTSVGGASVTSHNPSNGTGSVSSSMIDPNDHHNYIVNLSGVSTAQYITVTLTAVNDGVNNVSAVVGPQMGVLVGDVNASGVVTTGDVNLCKAQALQPVTNSNFRDDINFSGAITTGDVNLIKQQALTQLPSPP